MQQVLRYLCEEYSSTALQTDEGVAKLANELQDYGLTKGEVLQICNLAPVLPVELYCVSLFILQFSRPPTRQVIWCGLRRFSKLIEYVSQIIEEAEERFHPDASVRLTEIGHQIQSTLLETIPPELEMFAAAPPLPDHPDGTALLDHDPKALPLGVEEEFVHEAEYGPGKEDGIGEEKEGDMD